MPCITDISTPEMSNHFQTLLCKACKFLTLDQIKSLKNHSGIMDGVEWYSHHLWLDCMHNDDDVLDDSDGKKEKEIAIKELKRIGFEVKECDNGTELMECPPTKKVYPY